MKASDYGYPSARAYFAEMQCRFDFLPQSVWDAYDAMLQTEMAEASAARVAAGGCRADELMEALS